MYIYICIYTYVVPVEPHVAGGAADPEAHVDLGNA